MAPGRQCGGVEPLRRRGYGVRMPTRTTFTLDDQDRVTLTYQDSSGQCVERVFAISGLYRGKIIELVDGQWRDAHANLEDSGDLVTCERRDLLHVIRLQWRCRLRRERAQPLQ